LENRIQVLFPTTQHLFCADMQNQKLVQNPSAYHYSHVTDKNQFYSSLDHRERWKISFFAIPPSFCTSFITPRDRFKVKEDIFEKRISYNRRRKIQIICWLFFTTQTLLYK